MLSVNINQIRDFFSRERKTLKLLLYRNFYIRPQQEQSLVDNFHRLYYDSRLFGGTHGITYWLGTPAYKCPLDMWIYQEMIYDLRPDVIIETGTMDGGSALFMASMCDLVNNGQVISIDISHRDGRPQHDRLTYILGSSTDEDIVGRVQEMIKDCKTVMVVLDSDHTMQHVLAEMEIYHRWVTPGSYMIVEDTNMNGHPVAQEFGPGPMEAVDAFLKTNDAFVIDKDKEKFLLTFNPRGYLRKVK